LFDDNDMENVALDTHYYQAWNTKNESGLQGYCTMYEENMAWLTNIKYPVWVGEWSLATDNAAMWLGGFNDQGDSHGGKPY
jgi:hypothetical protein